MTLLHFPEYAPDVTPFEQPESSTIQNVFPQSDGYGPVGAMSAYTAALPAACRGFFTARNADASITIFAATSTRLWKLNNTDLTWVPISKVIALTGISQAAPGVFSLVSHGLSVGDAIVLSTSSGLPNGLTVGTVYYVSLTSFGVNSFVVSDTLAHALAGTNNVTTTSAGAGTHSFTGYYTAVPTGDQWQFIQFNNFVIAVQINTVPQVIDLTSALAFADLGGSPPQSRYIAVINRFVVLSGLGSSTPYRVQWSGLNATTTWTSGTNSSDYQDLPDGGIVRSIGGGEEGVITQDGAIRRMIYAPGSSVIFQIERISEQQGIFAPLSLVRAGDRLFYSGSDGFKMVTPGGYPQPIGKGKVDRTFFADVDTNKLQVMLGATDPSTTRVFWTYPSLTTSGTTFDKVLVYDFQLDRWSLITGYSGEYIGSAIRSGSTLDGLDTISTNLDTIPIGSLDDILTIPFAKLATFSTSHILSFVGSLNLEATLETSEQEIDSRRRVRVQEVRPDTDAPTCYISISTRENLQTTQTYSTESAVNAKGTCPTNVSTRLARAKLRIPASTVWTYASGVEPIWKAEGRW